MITALIAVAAIWERARIGTLALLGAGLAGALAVLNQPGGGVVDLIPVALGTACGIATLRLLNRQPEAERTADDVAAQGDPGRRRSLLTLALLGFGALSGVGGSILTRQRRSVAGDREAYTLPKIASPAPPIPPGVQPAADGLPSYITSNSDFYRIDTALSVPQLSREDWKLRIHGMVDREITYSFADLAKFELVERPVTLTCVSNPVGGTLIGNAMWTGYRIRDLLAGSGIHADADMSHGGNDGHRTAWFDQPDCLRLRFEKFGSDC